MIVVADTGPINYLILCGYIDLLDRLYGSLVIPGAVQRELLHAKAPNAVRQWASNLPSWVAVRVSQGSRQFAELGFGEREALALALETGADFLLMDETRARTLALKEGVAVKGTLGVLEEASAKRWIDLPQAIQKLRATSIFLSDDVVETVLRRNAERLRKNT
jgi:predicted nucleic acid-binding protein